MNAVTWASIVVLVAGSALVSVLYLREVYLHVRNQAGNKSVPAEKSR